MKTSVSVLLLFLLLFACENKKEYLIQVPKETRITSEYILSELEERAKEEPENDWLLNQQLYFCEQLDWPARCERPLLRAREKFGLSERLIDRLVAFYLKQKSYPQLESILNGAIETRERLEVRIRIGIEKDPVDLTPLNRYLSRNQDGRAFQLAVNTYLQVNDTIHAIPYIDKLIQADIKNSALAEHYLLLILTDRFKSAIKVIENQLVINNEQPTFILDLARSYYAIGKSDTAKNLLKKQKSASANEMLHDWYKAELSYDSALLYLGRIPDLNTNKDLILSKAELLEMSGSITRSLPYYEAALSLDTADVDLRKRVEIVSRKVAYLRKIREQKALPQAPSVERKKLGN